MSTWEILTYRIIEVPRNEAGWLQIFYFGFNAIEAIVWLTFSIIVLSRWRRYHNCHLELLYAVLFFLFGLSDVMELIAYPAWLLIAKAVILIGLLLCRRNLIKHHYPDSRF